MTIGVKIGTHQRKGLPMEEKALTTYEAKEKEIVEIYPFEDLVTKYAASLDMRPRSVKTYANGVRYFLSWMEAEGIEQPRDIDIIAYKKNLLETKSTTTAASYLTSVRSFFSWVHRHTGYPNIAEGIKNPKSGDRRKKDALSIDQAKELLIAMDADTLAQRRDKAIVTLLIHTGLRTIEIERANIEDIRTLAGTTVLYVWGKGRDAKDEYVKITDSVMETLKDYLSARMAIDGKLRDDDPLFTSVSRRNYGRRISARSVSRICKQSLRSAGYDNERLTAHSLRHTAVTTALIAGADLRDVQKMARHKSPITTERYAHDLRRLENAAEDAIKKALSE